MTNRGGWLAVAVALAIAVLGTGCGDAKGELEDLCSDQCAAVVAAGCAAGPDRASCEAACNADGPSCNSELSAINDCGPSWVCVADSPAPEGCEAQFESWQMCINGF